jgi:type I restriction enzyme, S subunit
VFGSVKVKLREIGTFERGKRFCHSDAVQTGIPCIHYGELYTYYGVSATSTKSFVNPALKSKLRFAHKNNVIIVGAGENNEDIGVGVAWLGDSEVAVHDACYKFVTEQNPKFISYFLRTHKYHEFIKKFVSEGKICSISSDGIGEAVIDLPSLERQAEIVALLDKFDSYSNDISQGLPAEIEARQKQYEYYRDKLLKF